MHARGFVCFYKLSPSSIFKFFFFHFQLYFFVFFVFFANTLFFRIHSTLRDILFEFIALSLFEGLVLFFFNYAIVEGWFVCKKGLCAYRRFFVKHVGHFCIRVRKTLARLSVCMGKCIMKFNEKISLRRKFFFFFWNSWNGGCIFIACCGRCKVIQLYSRNLAI